MLPRISSGVRKRYTSLYRKRPSRCPQEGPARVQAADVGVLAGHHIGVRVAVDGHRHGVVVGHVHMGGRWPACQCPAWPCPTIRTIRCPTCGRCRCSAYGSTGPGWASGTGRDPRRGAASPWRRSSPSAPGRARPCCPPTSRRPGCSPAGRAGCSSCPPRSGR